MKEAEKFSDSTFFEGFTSVRAVIVGADNGVNDRRLHTVYFDRNAKESKARELSYLRAAQKRLGFSLEFVSRESIDERCIGTSHGGIAAECGERNFATSLPASLEPNGFYVMLEGIEDPYNFGYAVRSLYAFGVKGLLLPERNWMSAAGIVCRASAGTSELLPVISGDCAAIARQMKEMGYSVVATAKERASVSLSDATLTLPLLLIIGGERRGISKKLLELADIVVHIDYGRGFASSLSAASAAAVLGYEVSRRCELTDK